MGSSTSKLVDVPPPDVPEIPEFSSLDTDAVHPSVAQVIPEIQNRVIGLESQSTDLQSKLSNLTERLDIVAPLPPAPEDIPPPGFFKRTFDGFVRHYHIWGLNITNIFR